MLKLNRSNIKYLNDPIFCYLTPEAEKEIEWLVGQHELDRDLALTLLELSWPEDRIYTLEE
jgi:hypothetical protein